MVRYQVGTVFNTATTIITYLMVFLIQDAQTWDAIVTQLKPDKLILSMHAARNPLGNLAESSEEEKNLAQEE